MGTDPIIKKLLLLNSHIAQGVTEMPIVHINVWEGFGKEKAKPTIRNITQVFVDQGIPREAVEIVITEIPKTHWRIGGKPASEL